VDVVDTARLHAIALLSPIVRSERLFAAACPFTWKEVVGTLRQIQPSNARIPDPPLEEKAMLGEVIPADRAKKLLQECFGQPTWTPIDVSLADGIPGEG